MILSLIPRQSVLGPPPCSKQTDIFQLREVYDDLMVEDPSVNEKHEIKQCQQETENYRVRYPVYTWTIYQGFIATYLSTE